MANNTKKKHSAARKLIPAAGMLAVSAAMLASSTYAWFTMNKVVTVTGMEVKTHVGPSLLVQKGALSDVTTLSEDGFITDETQIVQAVLEPVSTVDGQTFFYTVDARADGSKLHTPIGSDTSSTVNYTAYSAGLGAATGTNASDFKNKFSQDYEVPKTFVNAFVTNADAPFYDDYKDGAVGYVDYVFQLKAANTDSSAKAINLTKLDLTYAGATDGNKAYRAAVFVSPAAAKDGTIADWSTAIPNTVTPNIYCPSLAANFSAGNAVDSVSTRGSVTYIGDVAADTAVPIATVSANTISYYKVCVRLWIEGEDTTCNANTFMTLTDKWTLDLEMQLGQGTGVTALGMETTSAGGNTTPEP